jgi:glycerol uptake facilitator-like aquaporin
MEDKKYSDILLRRYIIAQILGGYIACLLVYNQWKVLIDEAEEVLKAAGPVVFAATQFTPNGPPGIFVPYLLPGQTLPRVFMNEFVNVRLNIYQKFITF